jgi:stearoyl-CoA desaturase (delta-9 desaturase)
MAKLDIDALPIPAKLRDKPIPTLDKSYHWKDFLLMVAIHLLPIGAFFTGASWVEWTACAVLFWVRMFAVTGGYHRYFSHRTFKTSRVFQFILAFLAMSSSQKGVLWWAAHHRKHHKYSDTPWDAHSPIRHGFWHAHLMWVYYPDNDATDYKQVRDLAKYPELVWLNNHWKVPVITVGVFCLVTMGLPGLFIAFGLSTALLWHATFTINSLSHVFGSRRFETTDTSRNNFLLALLTMGEGWHNNHHHYMGSTRQGFYWWEIDMTYYILKGLSWVGIVWDLRPVPEAVLEEGRRAKAPASTAAVIDAEVARRGSVGGPSQQAA